MPMHTKFIAIALVAAMAMSTAGAAEVSGVKFDDAIDLGGSKLVLNGAGTRYKAVFKVYAAGLYLGKKAATPEEVLTAPGNKRIAITMLRDIDANELGKLFSRGMEDNMPKSEFFKLIPAILRMGQMFSEYKNLKAGDVFLIDSVPGTGTVITIKGKPYGEPFKEAEFFNALARIWLGPNPADWKLKDAMLGKS